MSAPEVEKVSEQEKEVTFRCKDDPEANGRTPVRGEQRFTLTFPLEDGRSLLVHMGQESMNYFSTFIGQMLVDDDLERS